MRSDLKWSDGQPITARDLVFTYELLRDPALGSPVAHYVENLRSIQAENDSTVLFQFTRRYPEMITHSALAPLPEHVFRGVKPADIRSHPAFLEPAGGKLVTSGPWVIGQWEKGQRVVLTPNPHFQPQPYLSSIVFRIIPEAITRLAEIQTGNVDMVIGVTFDQIPSLKAQAGDRLRFEREQRRFYDYVAYQPKGHPAFADPEVRRALSMAINVPGILQALQMQEYAEPAGGPYSPIFTDLYDKSLTPPVAFAAERAKQTLDARGWRDADGDGVREKDGRPLRFSLVTNAGNQRRADAAQIIQQQWKQIGVDAELRQLEFNTFQGGLIQQNYQAALGGWSVNLSPDLAGLWGEGTPFNHTGYANPQVSGLIQQALAQPTDQAAAQYWKQAAGLIARDQPYTFLYYFDQVDAVSNRLRGTKIDTYGPYQNTWEWWIPAAQQRGAPTTPARPTQSKQ